MPFSANPPAYSGLQARGDGAEAEKPAPSTPRLFCKSDRLDNC